MSYAQGLKLGFDIASDAGRELRAGADLGRQRRMKMEIGKLLAAEDDTIEVSEGGKFDTELAAKQAQESGFRVAPPGAPVLPARTGFQMAPSASAQREPGVAPAPIQQQAFQPEAPRGLQMPNMLAPIADVIQKEQMVAAVEKPRTIVDPMSAATKYRKASALAAQYGDLELQKAYSDIAEKNFQTGILNLTGRALMSLDQGETKPLMNVLNNYLPDGLKYENGKVDEKTGNVIYDVVGDKGERSQQSITRRDIMERAQLLADPTFIKTLYQGVVATEAERAKRIAKREDFAFEEGTRQLGRLEIEGTRESGRNQRAANNLAVSWFNAKSADNARKAQTRLAEQRAAGNPMTKLKEWTSLDLDGKQANFATRLVAAGNTPEQVFAALSAPGGIDPSQMTWQPQVGVVIPAPGGGALRVDTASLIDQMDSPKKVVQLKEQLNKTVLEGLMQVDPNIVDKWASGSGESKRLILERAGYGLPAANFEKYIQDYAKKSAKEREEQASRDRGLPIRREAAQDFWGQMGSGQLGR